MKSSVSLMTAIMEAERDRDILRWYLDGECIPDIAIAFMMSLSSIEASLARSRQRGEL